MPVRTEQVDRTFVITIDRPQARNAIDLPTALAVAGALDELDARDDVHAGVITGAGGTFCAGMDLKAFLAGQRPSIDGRGFAGIVRRPPVKPIIAAVEGYALGGGFEIVLACDLVVAAEDAVFGLPEVTRGLTAAGGGLLRLHRRVPFNLAVEWALTGARIPAAEAHEVRLVNRLVPAGETLPAALELAGAIAANGPLATKATKRIIHESGDWPMSEAFDRQQPITEAVRSSADAREGARAFVERRRPEWTGT
ncbi:crotonase/enoyl-CoA hydratase family protein [Actinomadura sp. DC4]|uniref:crotonase/enoyl-CoA hydratase family protein n=1 Tax=Actinomadura sp. DC4 TaxID=3055069 RepID=UPI0025B06665|nr:crotonase/enoyl-CoA hydratase family protein [Actinomadura sp. DC4]MDN3356339.1 crotonase/enoyl-CoA hydratase family protein [Actinomadura sp. DC4]